MADDAARHVALVGMMGSGKTTVGRRLAARLEMPFVDLDDELPARTGRTVREWFAEGETAFREAEAQVLATVLDAGRRAVVATGGGSVTTAANRERLAAADVVVVWLRASPELLADRARRGKHVEHRPLLDGDGDVLDTLVRLSVERAGWYAAVADLTVDVDPVHRSSDHPKRRLAELVEHELREAGALTERGAHR